MEEIDLLVQHMYMYHIHKTGVVSGGAHHRTRRAPHL
jgi:hypothetical protein